MRAACAGAGHHSAALASSDGQPRSAQRIRRSVRVDGRRHRVACTRFWAALRSAERSKRSAPASQFPAPRPAAPRPRCSMRTLAICAEATVLPGWMARGSTWPEKRSTSTLWLTPICFSPAIDQVAVGQHLGHGDGDGAGEVVAVLGAALAVEGVARRCRRRWRGRTSWAETTGSAVTPASSLPLLSIVLVRLLAGADLLDDLHRQRVADQARAVVLEQRPVLARPGRSRRC